MPDFFKAKVAISTPVLINGDHISEAIVEEHEIRGARGALKRHFELNHILSTDPCALTKVGNANWTDRPCVFSRKNRRDGLFIGCSRAPESGCSESPYLSCLRGTIRVDCPPDPILIYIDVLSSERSAPPQHIWDILLLPRQPELAKVFCRPRLITVVTVILSWILRFLRNGKKHSCHELSGNHHDDKDRDRDREANSELPQASGHCDTVVVEFV